MMRRRLSYSALIPVCAAVFAGACDSPTGADAYGLEVILPRRYTQEPSRTWPTLVFLHGAGGLSGVDADFRFAAAQDPEFPFIVLMLDDRGRGFTSSAVRQTLDAELPRQRVDSEQLYITGLSAGAYIAWRVASNWNDRFAAIVLIAGGGVDELACSVKHIPVWLVHNRNDPVVPTSESSELAAAIRACNGLVTLTITEPASGLHPHNAWSPVYRSRFFWDWLQQQRLGQPGALPSFTLKPAVAMMGP